MSFLVRFFWNTDDKNKVEPPRKCNHVLAWTTVLLVTELAFSLELHLRQYKHLRSTSKIPEILTRYGQGMYTKADLSISRRYGLLKLSHEVAKKVYIVFGWIVVIYTNLINYAWTIAPCVSLVWPNFAFLSASLKRNMSFTLLAFLASQIFIIPIILHKHYWNNHNPISWRWTGDGPVLRHLKTSAVFFLPICILSGIFTSILQVLEKQALSLQIFVLASLSVSFILSYPILEIWYIFKRLTDSSIGRKKSEEFKRHKYPLEGLCDTVGFPRENLLIAETGSSASTFYFGFLFYRRIAVFLNVLSYYHRHLSQAELESILTVEEVEALLAHELGHWYDGHSDKAILLWHTLYISTGILTYCLHSNKTILFDFGFILPSIANSKKGDVDAPCIPGLIIAYFLILRSYYYILEIIYNLHQQFCEREADHFSASLGHKTNLGRGLIKLELEQRRPPSDNRFYSMFYHKHPCLVERLELLDSEPE